MPIALFGITNDGLNLFVNLVVLFLVVVWIALIVWTYLDARRRLEDPVLIGASTVASFFPFVGTIIYSILRPPEFLEDARERELDIRASELRVRQLEEQSCPNCGFPIERSYLRCPSCRARVKDPCESCGKPIDPRWALCPYCEAPTRRGAQQAAARRAAKEKESRPRRAPSEASPRRRKAAEAARPAPTAAGKPERAKKRAPARKQPTRGARVTAQRGEPKQRSQRSPSTNASSKAGAPTQESQAVRPSPDDEASSAPGGEGEESPSPATT
jgi:Double zinc ribbon